MFRIAVEFFFYALFREGELDLFYYSCKEHLDELIEVLRKHGDHEEELLTTFEERYDEIIRHMNVTQDLYTEKQGLFDLLICLLYIFILVFLVYYQYLKYTIHFFSP